MQYNSSSEEEDEDVIPYSVDFRLKRYRKEFRQRLSELEFNEASFSFSITKTDEDLRDELLDEIRRKGYKVEVNSRANLYNVSCYNYVISTN